MTFPHDFVDREREILLLEETLSKKRKARVLVFMIKPEHGKTYLMHHFQYICHSRDIPVTLIDFDQRGKDPVSYWRFVSNVRIDLGDKLFKNVNLCEKQHRSTLPLINYRPEAGGGGITVEKKSKVEDSELEDWVGRDRNLIFANYSGSSSDDVEREKRQRDEMGRAFMSDLSKICQDKPVVLILDAYEWASKTTRRWLDEWLFANIRVRYPSLMVVMAGRPNLRDYVMHPHPWKSLMYIHETFGNPEKKHIREYLKKSNLSVSDDNLQTFLVAANYTMSVMAKLRDAYLAGS